MINSLLAIEDAQALAQAIVNTIHEPFVVLDAELRVVAASRSFYETFQVDPEHTRGHLLFALGDGQWDVPALRLLLETIIPQHAAMDDFEVEHDFPNLGRRTMLLNARMVLYETTPETTILLAFTDVTARRLIEREKAELLAQTEDLLSQKRVLLQEMEHRVANSLQIIASILLLKAKAVSSAESREHLRDAHERVMSVAAVQSHLHASEGVELIEVGPYLAKLCGSLATSIIGGDQPPALDVIADDGRIGSAEAVSLGLIVTELVINALKYAFPERRPDAKVLVSYESRGTNWRLTVADNGVGKPPSNSHPTPGGLGTVIVAALVGQLNAQLHSPSGQPGVTVAITRGSLPSRRLRVA
jgi:chemotaxis protein methyltransferase CheR